MTQLFIAMGYDDDTEESTRLGVFSSLDKAKVACERFINGYDLYTFDWEEEKGTVVFYEGEVTEEIEAWVEEVTLDTIEI